jgi:hypothetical protein
MDHYRIPINQQKLGLHTTNILSKAKFLAKNSNENLKKTALVYQGSQNMRLLMVSIG